jgi:hypothetical protein
LKILGLVGAIAIQSQTVFALPANYESMKGCEKQNFLMENKVIPTQYKTLPELSAPDFLQLLVLNLGKTFDHVSDEMPEGRKKVFHTQGSVVPVSWNNLPGHSFSGLSSRA